MALELVVRRDGGWDVLTGLLSQDANLLAEGETYRQVFFLKPYPQELTSTLKANVDAVVATLKLAGVEQVSGKLSGQEVVLEYRVGINPLVILAWAMVIAGLVIALVIGYAVYKVVRAAGLPAWVAWSAAAAAAYFTLRKLRRTAT